MIQSRRFFFLLLSLLALSLVAACSTGPRDVQDDNDQDLPSDDNDDNDDNGDNNGDNNNGDNNNGDNNNGDDDNVGNDDEPEPEPDVENTAPATECPEGLTVIAEQEPNNGGSETDIHQLGTIPSPGFCIQGNVDCGNDGESYLEGVDLFIFTVAAGATDAEFGLDWTQSADIDFVLQGGEENLHEFEDGFSTSESAIGIELVEGVEYLVRVACWAGDDGSFAIWGTW